MDRELLHRGLPALLAFIGLGAAHQTGSERKGVGDWNRRNFSRMVSEYSGLFLSSSISFLLYILQVTKKKDMELQKDWVDREQTDR